MASSPMIGGADPAILKSLETQTPSVARTSPATVNASTGAATSAGSSVSRGLVPQVSGGTVTYNQATQATAGNSVTVTSSTSNDPADVVTIYTSPKAVSVSSVNQTVNTYKVNNYTGNEYTDSNVANYLPTFTGNVGAGNVNVTGTVYTSGISSTGSASLTTLNVSTTANLGAVGNITITGGTAGQVLTTNGSNVLSWTTVSGGNSSYGNSDVANYLPTFTGNIGANIVTANLFVGSGANLTNIPAGNISGTINLANYATTANSVALANVSGAGNIASANFDGNASNILHGDGTWSADITNYGNSNVANYLPTFTGNIGGNVITANILQSIGNVTISGKDIPANGTGSAGAVIIRGGIDSNNAPALQERVYINNTYIQGTTLGQDNPSANLNLYSAEGMEFTTAGGGMRLEVGASLGAGSSMVLLAGAAGEIGNGGFLNIAAGDAAIDPGNVWYGGNINISAGNASDNFGGAVNINSGVGSGNGTSGNINITSGTESWIFDPTGNLTFPGNIIGNGQALTGLAGANVTGTVGNANLSQYLTVSDVNNNFSYHVVLSAGSGDKSLHIDADDNLQYNPSDGTLTSVRVDATYVLANLNFANGYLASNLVGSASSIANGNSNVSITTANGNITLSAVGTANVLVVTGTGANITGTANVSGNLSTGGNLSVTGNTSVTGTLSSTGKIGYSSGSTVTQTTGRGNGVTINSLAGTIITTSVAMVANEIDTFSVINSSVDINNDIVLAQIVSPNQGTYNCIANPALIGGFSNGFYINIVNISGFTTSDEAITIRYMVIKAPNA